MPTDDTAYESAMEQGRALWAKRESTGREARRLQRETPDEARNEEGWTFEILAAERRHQEAMGEWLWWHAQNGRRLGEEHIGHSHRIRFGAANLT
jgi:hypothetical protein